MVADRVILWTTTGAVIGVAAVAAVASYKHARATPLLESGTASTLRVLRTAVTSSSSAFAICTANVPTP
jgi:hypothetical protein